MSDLKQGSVLSGVVAYDLAIVAGKVQVTASVDSKVLLDLLVAKLPAGLAQEVAKAAELAIEAGIASL